MSVEKRKAEDSNGFTRGLSCFRLGVQAPQPRKRACYDPQRRREVGEVRKRRACLRCRHLKLRVCPWLVYRAVTD
jgi:hypothetical protein